MKRKRNLHSWIEHKERKKKNPKLRIDHVSIDGILCFARIQNILAGLNLSILTLLSSSICTIQAQNFAFHTWSRQKKSKKDDEKKNESTTATTSTFLCAKYQFLSFWFIVFSSLLPFISPNYKKKYIYSLALIRFSNKWKPENKERKKTSNTQIQRKCVEIISRWLIALKFFFGRRRKNKIAQTEDTAKKQTCECQP